MTPRLAGLAVAAIAVLASAGTATASMVVNVDGSTVSPNRAGAPSQLTIKGTLSDTTGAKPPPPASVVLRFPPGGRVDPTVPGLCNPAKLTATGACPKDSVVATGTSTIDIRFGGISTLTAEVTAYNVKPDAGEKAAFLIHAVERAVTGVAADIRGRIVPAPGGALQLELLDLDKQIPTVLGIQPAVIGMDITTRKITKKITKSPGAKRKGRQRKGRHKARDKGVASFITNPSVCNGAWTVDSRFLFTDGQEITGSYSLPCSK